MERVLKTSPTELNKRITLQYQTKVPTGMGTFTVTWVDAVTVWAKSWTVSSTESSGDMTRTQKFKIRYRTVLKPYWRVKYKDRYFAILGIDPDEEDNVLYLTCKEAVS